MILALVDMADHIARTQPRCQLGQSDRTVRHMDNDSGSGLFGNLNCAADGSLYLICLNDPMGDSGFQSYQVFRIFLKEFHDLFLIHQSRIQVFRILIIRLSAGSNQKHIQEAHLGICHDRAVNMLKHSSSCSSTINYARNAAAEGNNICLYTTFRSAAHVMHVVVDQACRDDTAFCIDDLSVRMVFGRCGNFSIHKGDITFPCLMLCRIINCSVFNQKIHLLSSGSSQKLISF